MKLDEYLEHSECTQKDLAKRWKVGKAVVSHYVTGRRKVGAERVLTFSKATGWVVRPHDLRPDLYPNPNDGMPRLKAA